MLGYGQTNSEIKQAKKHHLYLNLTSRNTDISPKDMFKLFISEDILEEIAKRSNQYALTKSGMLPGIKSSEIKVFFGILLLSGYISLTNYELYWSNSLDTANTLVKSSMSRDRFKLIKRFLHLGSKGQLTL